MNAASRAIDTPPAEAVPPKPPMRGSTLVDGPLRLRVTRLAVSRKGRIEQGAAVPPSYLDDRNDRLRGCGLNRCVWT